MTKSPSRLCNCRHKTRHDKILFHLSTVIYSLRKDRVYSIYTFMKFLILVFNNSWIENIKIPGNQKTRPKRGTQTDLCTRGL